MKQEVECYSRLSFVELEKDVKNAIDEYNTEGYKLTNISHACYKSGEFSCMYSVIMIFEKES